MITLSACLCSLLHKTTSFCQPLADTSGTSVPVLGHMATLTEAPFPSFTTADPLVWLMWWMTTCFGPGSQGFYPKTPVTKSDVLLGMSVAQFLYVYDNHCLCNTTREQINMPTFQMLIVPSDEWETLQKAVGTASPVIYKDIFSSARFKFQFSQPSSLYLNFLVCKMVRFILSERTV